MNKITQTHRQIKNVLSVFVLLVIMCGSISAEVPPNPTTLANTTGDCWINHTWAAGDGVLTDSYNVSINDAWHNTTVNAFYKADYMNYAWQNITVYAFNSTGEGNISAANISEDTEVSGCSIAGAGWGGIVSILNQIPDILEPIPAILSALAKVAIFGAAIALTIGIVYTLRGYVEKLLKF